MKELFAKFGISENWIELNIVSPDDLRKAENSSGDNFYPEHARYRYLMDYLSAKAFFSDTDLNLMLQILDSDEDVGSGGLIYLLEYFSLTSDQYQLVSKHFIRKGPWAEDKLGLINLRKNLKSKTISINEIYQLISKQNAKEQNIILEECRLDEDVLKGLMDKSKFAKVVKRATHALKNLKRTN